MQYDFTVEEVSSSRQKLHFTVAFSDVNTALDDAYAALKVSARLPGYRKGKVPRWVLEKRFSGNIKSEVAQKLIDGAYSKIDQEAMKIVSRPQLEDMGSVSAKEDFAFVLSVDVQPTVEVTDYLGMDIVYPELNITEESVTAQIDSLLASKRKVQEIEDAEINDGDYALVALTLKDGEEEVVDEPGTMIHIGEHKFYTGVEEHLKGLKKGDKKDFEVTITEKSAFEHLRGNTYQASVEVQQVQRYITPELTDELAIELNYESAEGMKTKLQTEMTESQDLNLKNQARIEILRKLVAAHDFSVPEGMVETQLRALMEELAMQRMYAGEDPRKIKFSEAQLADLRNRAAFAAKASCLLSSISEKEGLKVNDDDINAKLQEMAEMRGQTIEAIKSYIESENADETLKERVQEEKTLNWLLEKSNRLERAVEDESSKSPESPESSEVSE